jgi:DNA-binding CsgD family transcriptional regulator
VKTFKNLERLQPLQQAKAFDGMNLLARKGNIRDLTDCYALHKSSELPYTETSKCILVEMWQSLVSKGAMQLFLVENRAKAVGSRIVSFNAVVFLTDEFCSEARSTLPPYLAADLARRYLSRQLPALSREQIGWGNSGDGLNAVMCFEGWAHHELSPEQLLVLREKQNWALHLALGGYQVKEFLADPVGRDTSQWMLNAGARLRREYSNYFRKNALSKPHPSRLPQLVGLTKEEAFAAPGSNLASLFFYVPPRFHFSRSQRVLLRHALMGETCEMLAASLSISPWTVKKYWHAIYERVADVDKELLPPTITCGAYALSRGAERRRRLLNYLRQHLEELRPFKANVSATKRSS